MKTAFLFSLVCFAARGVEPQCSAMCWADYYARAYGVPPEFVQAVIDVESAWQPYVISTKGAAGLMQLTVPTAFTFGVSNRFRIEENIRGGVAYLAYLTRLFNGDLRLWRPRTTPESSGSRNKGSNARMRTSIATFARSNGSF